MVKTEFADGLILYLLCSPQWCGEFGQLLTKCEEGGEFVPYYLWRVTSGQRFAIFVMLLWPRQI